MQVHTLPAPAATLNAKTNLTEDDIAVVIAATFPLDIFKWDGSHGVRGPVPLLFSEQPGEPGTVLELAPMRFIGPMKQIASRYITQYQYRSS